MGFSSGLTLQMHLFVSRNSIFCHSACVLCAPTPPPPPPPLLGGGGAAAAGVTPLSTALRGCGNEESCLGSNGGTRSASERKVESGDTVRLHGVKCATATPPNPPTTTTTTPCGAPSRGAFIRSNFQHYLALEASAQAALFHLPDKGYPPSACVGNTAVGVCGAARYRTAAVTPPAAAEAQQLKCTGRFIPLLCVRGRL